MQTRPREVAVTLDGLPGAVMWTEGGSRETAGREIRTTVPADALAELRVFVAAPGPGEPRRDAAFACSGVAMPIER